MSYANSQRMRSGLYVAGTAVVLLLAGACLAQNMDEARRIQATVLGVDTHNDTAQRVLIDKADIGKRLPDGMVDLPRLQEGGIHVPFFALWVPSYYPGAEAVRRTLDLRDAMQGVFDKYPDRIELATSAHDIERIVGQKKMRRFLPSKADTRSTTISASCACTGGWGFSP